MASKSSGVCNSSLATTLALIGAFLETAAPPMSPMMMRSLWEATALTMSVGVSRRASSFSGSGQMRMDISAPNSSTRPTPFTRFNSGMRRAEASSPSSVPSSAPSEDREMTA